MRSEVTAAVMKMSLRRPAAGGVSRKRETFYSILEIYVFFGRIEVKQYVSIEIMVKKDEHERK